MQIKKLKIMNIASLADAEIDFGSAPLSDAPIFLISGDTGAGKSTILDAICLALYGNTPRMMSATREIISMESDENIKLFANDNAQLLRRGTGFGQIDLTFTGNDGKDYVASWAVQRDYKKPGYKLQRDAKRTLVSLDGTFSENNINPIRKKIYEITGMDYDQFCRTVMLAQGEFTKFLKSTGKEKAEILEKLTGTEIYSEIGKRIAEKYSLVKSEWDNLDNLTKNIILLSEEQRNEKEAKITEDNEQLANVSRKSREEGDRLNWLTTFIKTRDDRKKAAEQLAALQLRVDSEDFRNIKSNVDDFRATVTVRHQIDEEGKLRSIIEKSDTLMPAIRKKYEDAVTASAEADNACREQQKIVETNAKKYEEFDVANLNRHINGLNDRISRLNDLQAKTRELDIHAKSLAETASTIKEKTSAVELSQKNIATLSDQMKEAEKVLDERTRRLDKLSISMNDLVKSMRGDLKAGEMCPVCGTVIVDKLEDEYFDSVLEPLRQEKQAADRKYNEIKARKLAEQKSVKSLNSELIKLGKKQKDDETTVNKLNDAIVGLLRELQYGESLTEDMTERIAQDLGDLTKEVASALERQKAAEECNALLQESQKKEKKLAAKLQESRKKEEEHRMAEVRAETDRKNNLERQASLKEDIAVFFAGHPSITRGRVDVLMKIREEDIESDGKMISKTESDFTLQKGAVSQLDSQLAEQENKRPEMEVLDGESEDDLAVRIQAQKTDYDGLVQTLSREIGELRQQLKTDDDERKRLSKILDAKEKIRDKKEKWKGLNRLLGNADGSRFRSVAQSFILSSLLDNANNYMRCFTDRYTLTCNPGSLAILVSDSYKPGDPQPASILSGGESFMASLSLALGLSSLRGGGMGVDIIFIDEGFGSLSSECLGNVMDTLEKLHQLGGRRVGLISHVPEMKERIPVQIHVQRESPALSRIEIVG